MLLARGWLTGSEAGQLKAESTASPAANMTFATPDRLGFILILDGGGRGIRTPDTEISPYGDLANRCLQPLGHPSTGNARNDTLFLSEMQAGIYTK